MQSEPRDDNSAKFILNVNVSFEAFENATC